MTNIYRGWAKLEPTMQEELSWLIFALNTPKTHSIGQEMKCTMLLPDADDFVPEAEVTVDQDGNVSLKNISDEFSTVNHALRIGEKMLPPGEKILLADKTKIFFGPFEYSFQLTDTPTARNLKALFDTLKCGVCSKLVEEARILSCNHLFCQSCLAALIDNALQIMSAVAPTPQPAHIQIEPAVVCPTCKTPSAIPDVTDSRKFKSVSEISKTIRRLNDDRPMCANCSNTRCLMHGSDYRECEQCKVIVCPMCAIDYHRKHELKYYYMTAVKASHQFTNKCWNVKQAWRNTDTKRESSIAKLEDSIKTAETFIQTLRNIEKRLDDEMRKVNVCRTEVESFENLRWGRNVSVRRNACLESFAKKLKESSPVMEQIVKELNTKSDQMLHREEELQDADEESSSESESSSSCQSSSAKEASTTTTSDETPSPAS